MQSIQPRNGYIHIKLNVPTDKLVIVPENAGVMISGTGDEASKFIEVLAIAPDVDYIPVGSFVLLRPDCSFMPYSSNPKTALVAASNVLGVYGDAPATGNS